MLRLRVRTPGPDLSKWHLVGYDNATDPAFSFPVNWCLGPLENGTCGTPAGLAAISYTINPLVSVLHITMCITLCITKRTYVFLVRLTQCFILFGRICVQLCRTIGFAKGFLLDILSSFSTDPLCFSVQRVDMQPPVARHEDARPVRDEPELSAAGG